MPGCPRCGRENPADARFCNACGAPLTTAAAPQETRKAVTVLFADVSGSTQLGERLDPEAVRRVMGRWFEAARAELERHGATVEKFVGDAVMAVFGVPVVHEDDALRAVRAAAGLRAALERLNAEFERDYGTRLEVRTGVNTGDVVVGEGETLATGDAVNVAARLEQAAAPGEILFGERTYRLVSAAVEAEPVDPLPLKGKSEAVAAYRLVGVFEDAPAFARRLDAPLVGRSHELGQLRHAYERAVRERAAVLYTLLGPAGIGKSRLAEEFLAGLSGEATVLRGRCLPYGEGITYWPLVEMLRGATTLEARGELATAQRALSEEGAATPEETAWAVRKLFEQLARERPLVVVADDLHWADATFLDLLDHVVDLSREAPILLLCLARSELLESRGTWGGGKLNATTALLEPLSEEEASRLVDALLASGELSVGARRRIADAAEGNPLFIEQMLALAREDGRLEVAVPPTIQALLAARLDRLGYGERAVIGRAAVEGKLFHRGAVAELAPEEVRPEVSGHLTALVRKELVRPSTADLPGEDAFVFRHHLIRDAAYESMPKEVRAELHERFADWLERVVGERASELEEILGYHLEQAYRYRAELGPVGAAELEIARRSAALLLASARKASARSDLGAARNLLDRATGMMPGDDPARPGALVDLARTLVAMGEFSTAESLIEEARRSGDRRDLARAKLAQIELEIAIDPTSALGAALVEVEEATRTFEELGDLAGALEARLAAGRTRFFLGEAGASEEAYVAALELARELGDQKLINETLGWLLLAKLMGPASAEDGLALVDELELSPGPARVDAWALLLRGQLLAAQGQFEEARESVRRGHRLMEELGVLVTRGGSAVVAGAVELYAGDLDAAERELRYGDELLASLGEAGYRSTVAASLANVLVAQGRDEEAEALLRELEGLVSPDDFDPQVRGLSARARIAASRGELSDGEHLAREARAVADRTDFLDLRAEAALALADVLRAAGRIEEAAAEVEGAIELYERKGIAVMAERSRALLDELRATA